MSKKKDIRNQFRKDVFKRDNFKCIMCDFVHGTIEGAAEVLDAHHITDRNQMPDGGYVKQNGITLCKNCHWKAEAFHRTGQSIEGYSPEDLYNSIGSSFEKAIIACERINGFTRTKCTCGCHDKEAYILCEGCCADTGLKRITL